MVMRPVIRGFEVLVPLIRADTQITLKINPTKSSLRLNNTMKEQITMQIIIIKTKAFQRKLTNNLLHQMLIKYKLTPQSFFGDGKSGIKVELCVVVDIKLVGWD